MENNKLVIDVLEKDKGKIFLPHEVAKEVSGKVSCLQLLRTLESEAKKGEIIKLNVKLKIGKRYEISNAFVYPVGCSLHNSPCFEDWCPNEDCPRMDIMPRSTYSGLKIVKHKTIRKEDNSFEKFMKEGYDIDV